MLAAAPSEGVAVAVTVVATVVVLAVLAATAVAVVAARRLRRTADALAAEVERVLGDVQATLAAASSELSRVDDLIGSAEALTGTIGAASRLAHATVASPVIKVMALSRGTSRAGSRLRGRRSTRC